MLPIDESLKLGRWQVNRFNEKRAWKKSNFAFQELLRCAVSGGRYKERLINGISRLIVNAIIGRDVTTDQCWGGHDATNDVDDGSFDVMALSLKEH